MTRLVKDEQVVETTNAPEIYRLKASGFVVVDDKPERPSTPAPRTARRSRVKKK